MSAEVGRLVGGWGADQGMCDCGSDTTAMSSVGGGGAEAGRGGDTTAVVSGMDTAELVESDLISCLSIRQE